MRRNPYCYILTCPTCVAEKAGGISAMVPLKQVPFDRALATGDTNVFVFSFASVNHYFHIRSLPSRVHTYIRKTKMSDGSFVNHLFIMLQFGNILICCYS